MTARNLYSNHKERGQKMSDFLTQITCAWGGRGSGKTTLAKKLVKEANPKRLVIIDPLSMDGVNADKAIAKIKAGDRLIICNAQNHDDALGVVLLACAASCPADPIYVICDEAPAYLNSKSAALSKVAFQGRHAAFGMFLIGQRPTSLNVDIRSQTATTYYLRMQDNNDIKAAAFALGTERAKTLYEFQAGDFIRHPPEPANSNHAPPANANKAPTKPTKGKPK